MAKFREGVCFPPGFRFHPTDAELVGYYLKRKIAGQPITGDIIPEIEFYKFEPWDLPESDIFPDSDRYFFSPLELKTSNGANKNRATEKGFWKASGKDQPVSVRGKKLGMKKILVFYLERAPKGVRTDWVMHEYRLESSAQATFVLCRVFNKKNDPKDCGPALTKEASKGEVLQSGTHGSPSQPDQPPPDFLDHMGDRYTDAAGGNLGDSLPVLPSFMVPKQEGSPELSDLQQAKSGDGLTRQHLNAADVAGFPNLEVEGRQFADMDVSREIALKTDVNPGNPKIDYSFLEDDAQLFGEADSGLHISDAPSQSESYADTFLLDDSAKDEDIAWLEQSFTPDPQHTRSHGLADIFENFEFCQTSGFQSPTMGSAYSSGPSGIQISGPDQILPSLTPGRRVMLSERSMSSKQTVLEEIRDPRLLMQLQFQTASTGAYRGKHVAGQSYLSTPTAAPRVVSPGKMSAFGISNVVKTRNLSTMAKIEQEPVGPVNANPAAELTSARSFLGTAQASGMNYGYSEALGLSEFEHGQDTVSVEYPNRFARSLRKEVPEGQSELRADFGLLGKSANGSEWIDEEIDRRGVTQADLEQAMAAAANGDLDLRDANLELHQVFEGVGNEGMPYASTGRQNALCSEGTCDNTEGLWKDVPVDWDALGPNVMETKFDDLSDCKEGGDCSGTQDEGLVANFLLENTKESNSFLSSAVASDDVTETCARARLPPSLSRDRTSLTTNSAARSLAPSRPAMQQFQRSQSGAQSLPGPLAGLIRLLGPPRPAHAAVLNRCGNKPGCDEANLAHMRGFSSSPALLRGEVEWSSGRGMGSAVKSLNSRQEESTSTSCMDETQCFAGKVASKEGSLGWDPSYQSVRRRVSNREMARGSNLNDIGTSEGQHYICRCPRPVLPKESWTMKTMLTSVGLCIAVIMLSLSMVTLGRFTATATTDRWSFFT